MRKYGTTMETSDLEVEQPDEEAQRRTSSNPDWSPEDERDLQREARD